MSSGLALNWSHRAKPPHRDFRVLHRAAEMQGRHRCGMTPACEPLRSSWGGTRAMAAAVPRPDAAAAFPGDRWWTLLNDSDINALADHAMVDSRSVTQAVARVDEARARLGSDAVQRLPAISLNGTAARARNLGTRGDTSATTLETTASSGLGLSREMDLFGRVRKSVEAARHRLDARTADAAAARLSLAAQIANSVQALRACHFAHRCARGHPFAGVGPCADAPAPGDRFRRTRRRGSCAKRSRRRANQLGAAQ